jgi:hypothetical protein
MSTDTRRLLCVGDEDGVTALDTAWADPKAALQAIQQIIARARTTQASIYTPEQRLVQAAWDVEDIAIAALAALERTNSGD